MGKDSSKNNYEIVLIIVKITEARACNFNMRVEKNIYIEKKNLSQNLISYKLFWTNF